MNAPDASDTIDQPAPTDAELTATLARLIYDRIALFDTLQTVGMFAPAHERERYVLLHLRDHWLREANGVPG